MLEMLQPALDACAPDAVLALTGAASLFGFIRVSALVVRFEPGEKHWHGAAPTTAMTHIAVQEALDGQAVQWLEPVTDEQYHAQRGTERSPRRAATRRRAAPSAGSTALLLRLCARQGRGQALGARPKASHCGLKRGSRPRKHGN